MTRKPCPSDVTDDEWAFVATYQALLPLDALHHRHGLREVFNGLHYIVKTGASWRWLPNDLPPWELVYQQTQRWLCAGVFEAMVHDMRVAAGHRATRAGAVCGGARQPHAALQP